LEHPGTAPGVSRLYLVAGFRKLVDAGGAVEGDIEAEIAKIVEETVKPSKP
jgi:hypothetical protein